ncbi:MAG: orotidine-5'-phosphate decarboxylase [Candidatus Gottesmanbacteria bacterium]|nr:orotidine-5'-phosphate decarboxylase [Candidatus Gottesmanbacteria bacterium]
MTFQQKLDDIVSKNNSLVCVGLDSDISKIPEHTKKEKYPQFSFNKAIIDATHDVVCAYKPNSAFYEAFGAAGITELKMTCDYLHQSYPEIPIILDAKRADIGSTNEGYASYAFDYLGVDAITLHPYLGREALQPFFDRKDKGCIILCKTSNPGAGEFQDLKTGGKPLYQVVAQKVTNEWNINGNCMLVVGAPYPEELAIVRRIVGDMTLLVPGIGTQGGDIEKAVKAGINSTGAGMIINASRSIIFASSGSDYVKQARSETVRLRAAINTHRGSGDT